MFLTNVFKLKNPARLLCLILILYLLLFTADVIQEPQKQISVKLTVQAIKLYQRCISPNLQGKIKCVYEITCSHYAILALEKYGFVKGMYLSLARIFYCRQSLGPLPQWQIP